MNRFKSQVLLAAGFAVLAGVVSGITAAPAIAAAVKAALIKNVDERGRIPYTAHFGCFDAGLCVATGPVVAPNMRLVIEHVSVDTFTNSLSEKLTRVIVGDTSNSFRGFGHPELNEGAATANIYATNIYGPYYVEAGESPTVQGNISSGSVRVDAYVTGYLIDLTI